MDKPQEVQDLPEEHPDPATAGPGPGPLPEPARKRRPIGRRYWLFVIPLLGWFACLGLAVYLLWPLVGNARQADIPVTGGDPGRAPARETPAPAQNPADGPTYLSAVKQRLDACSSSFHDYFLLEQLAVNRPEVLHDSSWRSDISDAMDAFRQDCQPLGTLPAAPRAYADVDHWLKLAAGEIGPTTDGLATAINKDQDAPLHSSVEHMLKFVDYLHNAENALNGLNDRKEI